MYLSMGKFTGYMYLFIRTRKGAIGFVSINFLFMGKSDKIVPIFCSN